MGYNITDIDNSTSMTEWVVNVNTAASGLPANILLVILWVGTYVFASSRNLNPGESFTLTNFFVLIIASLFYFAGMTSLNIVIALVVLFFLGVGYLMFK